MKQKYSGTFVENLETGIHRAGIENHHSILCAVSGGTDSTALLLGLQNLKHLFRSITAGHYNHRARAEESDLDEEFVRQLCADHEIPLVVGRAAAPSYNLDENSARRERYQFLVETAERVGADTIAMAHTIEDQAETILLRITRGAGSRGASGMKPRRSVNSSKVRDLTITRPMLHISRSQAESFLESLQIVARHDSSNDDWVRYARNRIRHRVIPELKELNPQAISAIVRFGEIQKSQTDLLNQLADQTIQDASTELVNVLLRSPVASSHRAVAAEVLSKMFRALADHETHLEQSHIENLVKLISTGESASYNLPDGITFWTDHANIRFNRQSDPPTDAVPYPEPISQPINLTVGGRIDLGNGYAITSEITTSPQAYRDDSRNVAWLNIEALPGDFITIRNRKIADAFQPLGMEMAVNLADFLINSKVAASWRDRIPMVVNPADGRIAWLPGVRIAEWAKVPEQAKLALKVRFLREP